MVVRTPPEVSLYHRFENDLFAQVLERLRVAAVEQGVQPVVLPRVDGAAARSWSECPGSWCPSRRSTRSR